MRSPHNLQFGLGSLMRSPHNLQFGLGSLIGSPNNREFQEVVPVDNTARPMVEAAASVTMHARIKGEILVAFTPPYGL